MIDINRKEFKYILPLEKLRALSEKLDALMERDVYGDRGRYLVRSQYFDSIWDRDLLDNLNGVMEKRKIRLRVYSPEDQTAKLEYKCKSGDNGRKLSMTVTRQEASWLEAGRWEWLLEREEPLAAWLSFRMAGSAYLPKTIVEYQRLAYAGQINNTRITMDTQMRGTMFPCGLFEKDPPYIPLMEPDVGILEIKYDYFLPDYLRGFLNTVDHLAESNSKYTRARMLL